MRSYWRTNSTFTVSWNKNKVVNEPIVFEYQTKRKRDQNHKQVLQEQYALGWKVVVDGLIVDQSTRNAKRREHPEEHAGKILADELGDVAVEHLTR